MPTAFTLRDAHNEDWSGLWPLLQKFGSVSAEDDVYARFLAMVEDPSHLLAIALESKMITGYIWAQDTGPHLRAGHRTARLHDLFVAPESRRHGIARLLMKYACHWARNSDVRYLQWQANRSSVGFYEALGLQAIADPDPEHPFFELEFE